MDEQSRRRLAELAGVLGGLLDDPVNGSVDERELQSLLRLADGFVGVLLHEVERERAAARGALGT